MPRQRNWLQNILPKGERQDNGCLLYTHNRKKNGSSLVSYGDEMMPVHRVVYLEPAKKQPGQSVTQPEAAPRRTRFTV